MTTCDLLANVICDEPADYRVWLAGPCQGRPCPGHAACATCTAVARAGKIGVPITRVESWGTQ